MWWPLIIGALWVLFWLLFAVACANVDREESDVPKIKKIIEWD
jgi:hypothetical protein